MDTIWIAIITVIGNLAVSLLTNSKTQSLLEYKIDELSKRVTAHNNLVERMYNVETRLTVVEKQLDDLDKEE